MAENVPHLLMRAEGSKSRAGIVLLQEIFGINANMRAVADDFRRQGFDVAVPDLFWRQEPGVQLDPESEADRARATALMKGLDENLALGDIEAVVSRLRRLDNATGKVAAVGYCLGGRLAYLAAADGLVDAAVSYYGVGIHRALGRRRDITAPLLLHVAEEDHLCDHAAQDELRQAFAAQTGTALFSYAGVGHAFARRDSPSYRADAAEAADSRTAVFLKAVLGGAV